MCLIQDCVIWSCQVRTNLLTGPDQFWLPWDSSSGEIQLPRSQPQCCPSVRCYGCCLCWVTFTYRIIPGSAAISRSCHGSGYPPIEPRGADHPGSGPRVYTGDRADGHLGSDHALRHHPDGHTDHRHGSRATGRGRSCRRRLVNRRCAGDGADDRSGSTDTRGHARLLHRPGGAARDTQCRGQPWGYPQGDFRVELTRGRWGDFASRSKGARDGGDSSRTWRRALYSRYARCIRSFSVQRPAFMSQNISVYCPCPCSSWMFMSSNSRQNWRRHHACH